MFKFLLKPATTNRRTLSGNYKKTANIRQKTSATILLNGREIPYTIVTGGIARYVHIKITASNGLELIVPRFYNLSNAQFFMLKKQDWILKNLKKHEQQSRHKPPEFSTGIELNILGTPTKIILYQRQKSHLKKIAKSSQSHAQTQIIFLDKIAPSQELHIFAPTIRKAKTVFQNYLKKEFKKFIHIRTGEFSKTTGLNFNKITVRAQKTRWGSCSSRNNLNFNWLLSLVPPASTDYVILHELCHTIHHNHSKKFYTLLQTFCPNYKTLRKELHTHQGLIDHFAK